VSSFSLSTFRAHPRAAQTVSFSQRELPVRVPEILTQSFPEILAHRVPEILAGWS
jgi:hypothetical protein